MRSVRHISLLPAQDKALGCLIHRKRRGDIIVCTKWCLGKWTQLTHFGGSGQDLEHEEIVLKFTRQMRWPEYDATLWHWGFSATGILLQKQWLMLLHSMCLKKISTNVRHLFCLIYKILSYLQQKNMVHIIIYFLDIRLIFSTLVYMTILQEICFPKEMIFPQHFFVVVNLCIARPDHFHNAYGERVDMTPIPFLSFDT